MSTSAPAFPSPTGQLSQGLPPGITPGKTVRACKYFFLPLETLFTSTTGEQTFNQSQTVDFPVNVRGATTNLSLNNRVEINEPSKFQFSFAYMPFGSIVYRTNNVQQYNWWIKPYPLAARQPLQAQFINDNGDPDGFLMMFCEKADTYQPITITQGAKPYWLTIDWKYTGAGQTVVTATNQQIGMDLLILGATYSGNLSANTFQVTDLTLNYQWSNNFFLPEFFFGIEGQINPVLKYPSPYFLPANGKLQIQTNNISGLTATEHISFYCIAL